MDIKTYRLRPPCGTASVSSGSKTDLEKATTGRFSPKGLSPASLVFGACCVSQTFARSLNCDHHNIAILHSANEKANTAALIQKLNESEDLGRAIIEQAREKRRFLSKKATAEANEEANIYAEQFKVEFEKLEKKHYDEMKRLTKEIATRLEKDLDSHGRKKQRARQRALYYVLDRTCDIDCELSEVAASKIMNDKAREVNASRRNTNSKFTHRSIKCSYTKKEHTEETSPPISPPPTLKKSYLESTPSPLSISLQSSQTDAIDVSKHSINSTRLSSKLD